MSGKVKTKKNRVGPVSAVVYHREDLPLIISLQNVVNYILICIRDISSGHEIQARARDLESCAREMENICSRGDLGEEVLRIRGEFVEELGECSRMLGSAGSSRDDDIMISTRCSSLQWLGVCMLEELKTLLDEPH
ncbi:MAG: hypothetical protein ACLFQB_10970 [Chitinispirillaceae bacterium]